MPIKNGKEYIERIDHQKINLWYNGQRVTGLLSEHPAFRGLIHTQADLYDMQCDEQYAHLMTYKSPLTGDPVGLSFLPPMNKEDLLRRGQMIDLWSKRHHGFLGRSPDYMNTVLMSLYTAAAILEEDNPKYANNLRSYYDYCRDNDITLSHAFVQPFASKWSAEADSVETTIACKVVEITNAGLIVSGAFVMATQGATCEEILVLPTPNVTFSEDINPTAIAFAVPNDLDGMTFICRDSYAHNSSFDYPLSSRFDEMDTMVIFDKVLIPHNRVFYYGNEDMANRLFTEGNFLAYAGHQVVSRYIAKMEFFLGLIQSLAEEQNASVEMSTIDQISRIMMFLENLKALRLASETEGATNHMGYFTPATSPLLAACLQFPDFHREITNMIQMMSSSSLIMSPSGANFESDIKPYMENYLKGIFTTAEERVALFRLAWELGAGAFGGDRTSMNSSS
ncbi:4-hydroxyphenylacetate 3-hydroxylase N-terminal domain-containing protein [Paenibacillus sp. D2_2]|uniref:4-hydroxyphenylacetate 3-hydroxylase N-terminal domain-containing protein n=1 Tax=Paenibacillus sp. D2_2 TaxID=3073092 RepID=UPI002814DA62|nr:4-hydroxyphenylacetate 3-hydroxylase N-terminal domain-containing protein [Paenibacillus sp. D2_2]WMT39590.1 4-hydroxyphenylacetate 3-hydroxylase N-terminal domain-containing protein [Paenibacillus sp. D2_2]